MRTRLVLLVAVLAATGPINAGAPRAGAAASDPGFSGCTPSTLRVRPHSILVACGDGNFYLTGLNWSSWNAGRAEGSGIAHQNDCRPSCAKGHFHLYPVTVRLFRPVTCKSRSRVFTRLSWRFLATKPPERAHSGTQSFRCP